MAPSLIVQVSAVAAIANIKNHSQPAFPFSLFAGTSQTVTLEVKNMTCAVCPITVRKALEKVQGVTSATVNFDTKQARVTFDDALASVDKLREATANAGYPSALAETT